MSTATVSPPRVTTAHRAVSPGSQWTRRGLLLASTSVVSGLLSYAATIALAHIMVTDEYTRFVSVQALLLFAGTALSATVAWTTAAALTVREEEERAKATAFTLQATILCGLLSAAIIGAVAATFTGAAVASCAGIGVFVCALAGLGYGRTQAHTRFTLFATLRLGEAALRSVCAIALAVAGYGVFGAVIGFTIAAAAVIVGAFGTTALRASLWGSVRRRCATIADKARWQAMGSLGVSQLGLGALASLDLVWLTFVLGSTQETADLQVALTLGRIPLFAAMAMAQVVFAAVRRGGDVTSLLSLWTRGCTFAAVVLATLPLALLALLVPRASAVSALLPLTAGLGLTLGAAVLCFAVLQANDQRRAGVSCVLLCVAGAATGQMLGALAGGVSWATMGEIAGVCLGLVFGISRVRRFADLRSIPLSMLGWLLFGAVLWLTRSIPLLWIPAVAFAAVQLARSFSRARTHAPEKGLPRILHLGFEDPRMPGAGGGSMRTHEINRRLAHRFHITVFTSRFPGCRDGLYDGVTYKHIGVGRGRGHFGRMIGYALAVIFQTRKHLRQHNVDLVIEDFFAPISSLAAPRWSGRPTIAIVQWLNANEKSRQYHLPFFLVERMGVAAHHTFITVSSGIRERLREMNPHAEVVRIGNGVDPIAFDQSLHTGEDIVFVGRIERDQKGTDLLVRAFAGAADRIRGNLVIIGDGPDTAQLKQMVRQLGIVERVTFAGRIDGAEKFSAMANAAVVVVPSRFETFGIVAAEALAVGSGVVAFDIDCLREIVPTEHGTLVQAFDTDALGDALAAHTKQPGDRAVAQARREFAAQFSWDDRAMEQARVYHDCLVRL